MINPFAKESRGLLKVLERSTTYIAYSRPGLRIGSVKITICPDI